MAEQYANDAVTTLAAGITSSATSLTVASAGAFPTSGNFRIRIDGEILTVTAVSGATFTVSRATEVCAGVQAAAAHSAGATVEHVLTAASVVLAGASFPSGMLMPYAASGTPSGWLTCDGSAVSRSTYSALFTAIGTTWGAGNGSTTFNVPDLQDRVVIGTSPGSLSGNRPTARTLAQTGGEETHVLSVAELPAHNHGINDPGHFHLSPDSSYFLTANGSSVSSGSGPGGDAGNTCTSTATTGITTNNAGSGTAHNTMQPFAVVQWLIKT
jgi:microcystin-dependent protein